MYADDTNSADGLQKGLDDLHTFCQGWRLKVNEHQTEITIFGSRKVKQNDFNFSYQGKG